MLSLYERVRIFLEQNPMLLMPLDISKTGDTVLHKAFTAEGGLSLYHSSLSQPDERHLSLPKGVANYLASLSSDDSWTLTAVDFDGSEKHQLCRFETEGIRNVEELKATVFSEIKPHRILHYTWSPNDDGILFTGSKEEDSHVSYVKNTLTSKPRIVLDGLHGPLLLDWKHNDLAFVLCHRDKNLRKGLILIFNCRTGERVEDLDNLVSMYFEPEWHPKKPILPYLKPEGDFGNLTLYDAESEERIELNQPEGDITVCRWGTDGGTLYVTTKQDGRSTISAIDVTNNECNTLDISKGTNYVLTVRKWNDSETMFYAHTDSARSTDLWVYDIEQASMRKLTDWQDPAIGTEDFPVVPAESIKYESSYDGLTIHGFFLKPDEPPPPDGYPLIMWSHGGPTAHYSDMFLGWFQILTQEGFAVFAPNYRGSTGYGTEFMKKLFQEAGKGDLEDVSSGADYIAEKYQINREKIAIGGGSYGGFMTLAALAFQPEKWAGGCSMVPVADWWYMYENSDDIYRKFIGYMWGNPEENKDLIIEGSPISKVNNVKAPLRIYQRANDSRTPLPPVLEFANRLYERNHNLELEIEPQSGHASIQKDSTIRSYAANIHFFRRVLGNE